MNREAIEALMEKVEAGECPTWTQITGGIGIRPDNRHLSFHEAFHGSLDAAKALHEAVLPGWGWSLNANAGKSAKYMQNALVDAIEPFRVHAANSDYPARAWLIAILRALLAKEGDV